MATSILGVRKHFFILIRRIFVLLVALIAPVLTVQCCLLAFKHFNGFYLRSKNE